MTIEPTITMTRAEFIAYTQRIQDLALMGAFIFMPGMNGSSALKDAHESRDCIFPAHQPQEPMSISEVARPKWRRYRKYTKEEITAALSCYNARDDMEALAQSMGRTENCLYRLITALRAKHGAVKVPFRGYGKDQIREKYSALGGSARYMAKDL